MRCRCHPENRCGRCDEVRDYWTAFGLFWWLLGGAVNGVPIMIDDAEDEEVAA